MSTQSPFFGKRTRDAEADPHMDFSPSAAQVANATLAAAMDGGSKLIVGPNIKLKGVEITDCDTLEVEVEGVVEASMDARVMKIAEQGVFKGSAQFDLVTSTASSMAGSRCGHRLRYLRRRRTSTGRVFAGTPPLKESLLNAQQEIS